MKLRESCKCGASFEASGIASTVGGAFDGWRSFHNLVCYGVSRTRKNDDGSWTITPDPPVAARRAASPQSSASDEERKP